MFMEIQSGGMEKQLKQMTASHHLLTVAAPFNTLLIGFHLFAQKKICLHKTKQKKPLEWHCCSIPSCSGAADCLIIF